MSHILLNLIITFTLVNPQVCPEQEWDDEVRASHRPLPHVLVILVTRPPRVHLMLAGSCWTRNTPESWTSVKVGAVVGHVSCASSSGCPAGGGTCGGDCTSSRPRDGSSSSSSPPRPTSSTPPAVNLPRSIHRFMGEHNSFSFFGQLENL